MDGSLAASRSFFSNAAVCASYTTSHNWQPTNFQNYAIAGSLFIQDDLQRINRRQQHKLLADLSYLKLVDEVLTPMCSTRMNSSSYSMQPNSTDASFCIKSIPTLLKAWPLKFPNPYPTAEEIR